MLIETPEGLGFASRDYHRWSPKTDLIAVAWAIQRVLEADDYRVGGLSIESELPPVWLDGGNTGSVAKAVRRIRATVGVDLDLAVDVPKGVAQYLHVFISEASSPADAVSIAAAAVPGKINGRNEALGVAVGDVAVVMVGQSGEVGVAPHEGRGALERFRGPIGDALARLV